MTRRLLVFLGAGSVLCGVLVATILAAALPRSSAAPAGGDVAHPSVAPARPPSAMDLSGNAHLRVFGAATIEARTRDPLGGPDWAVRVARQQYFARNASGQMRPMNRPQRCAQLGRLLDGRFGWIDGANVFRPVPFKLTGAPLLCGPTTPDFGRQPQLRVVTRIAEPESSRARLLQTIAWGLTGGADSADLRVDGHRRAIRTSRHGIFVRPIALTPGRPDVRLTVRRPPADPIVVSSSFRGDAEQHRAMLRQMLRAMPARLRPQAGLSPLPRAGVRAVIDDRVLDSNGRLPLGQAVVPSEAGGWCVSWLGRVVGQRVGGIDLALGTFTDAGPAANFGCLARAQRPTVRRPLVFIYTFSQAENGVIGGPPSADRIARRTQPGRLTIDGVALAAVRSITIATPRDVRTIAPSPRAHAFAVVYDGDFPTGKITITARLAGGRVYRTPPFSDSLP